MKKTIIAIVLLFSITLNAQLNPLQWLTDGIKTNPGAATVLAHYTNPLPNAENHIFHLVCASTVGAILFVEHLDTANVVLRSQAIAVNALVTFEAMKFIITLDINETYRIRTSGALTGQIQCSIYMDQ